MSTATQLDAAAEWVRLQRRRDEVAAKLARAELREAS